MNHTPQFSPIKLNISEYEQNENDASISNSFRRIILKNSPSPDREVEQEQEQEEENEESLQQRRLREESESEALCRQIMAEEAMSSYHQSTNYLQDNASEYNAEDLAAITNLMAEEDPNQAMADMEEEAMDSDEMSYEALLNLGERIGDVKGERWAMKAKKEIAKLEALKFCKTMAEGKDENDSCAKCLVCQFQFEEEETIRVLPCRHYFHDECVDQWLMAKDCCPYCRQCIVIEEN
jgi:E3 ubiquitin-protein ligase BIG BROTHER-like protein